MALFLLFFFNVKRYGRNMNYARSSVKKNKAMITHKGKYVWDIRTFMEWGEGGGE